jgi:signal transduction histidine kinase
MQYFGTQTLPSSTIRDDKFIPWRRRHQLVAIIFLLALGVTAAPVIVLGGALPEHKDEPLDYSTTSDNLLKLMGDWIWDDKVFDGQTCQLWQAFDVPSNSKVINARILLTADNEFTLFFDGREIGHGAEWRELFDYNLTLLMSPGRHVLAVKALNPSGPAGMLLGMRIELASGQLVEIKSDQRWKIVPDEAKSWKEMTAAPTGWAAAKRIAALGDLPWWTTPVNVNPMLTLVPIKIFFWQTAWFQVPFLIVCGLIALTIFFLAAQLALHQKEHWLLQRERARIAMDIHDDIGSRMTHLVLNGEVVQDELPTDSKARDQLEQICDDARGVLSSIDEILWTLNPRRDTLQDFADYVCDYAQKFLGPADIECVFEVDSETLNAAADLPLRRSLLMAIKETLHNTVKYSGATELRLQIGRQRQSLVVVVQDNGRGFDSASIRPGRNGLSNMSRRMRELGGSCSVSSETGKGCRIEFCIPLRSPRRLSLSWIWRRKQRVATTNKNLNPNPDKDSNPQPH